VAELAALASRASSMAATVPARGTLAARRHSHGAHRFSARLAGSRERSSILRQAASYRDDDPGGGLGAQPLLLRHTTPARQAGQRSSPCGLRSKQRGGGSLERGTGCQARFRPARGHEVPQRELLRSHEDGASDRGNPSALSTAPCFRDHDEAARSGGSTECVGADQGRWAVHLTARI